NGGEPMAQHESAGVSRRLFLTGTALGTGAILAPAPVARAFAAPAPGTTPTSRGVPDYEPTLASLDRHPVPRWYADAKFGIFVHWGAYAVPAGYGRRTASEWYLWDCSFRATPGWEYHRRTYGEQLTYDDF